MRRADDRARLSRMTPDTKAVPAALVLQSWGRDFTVIYKRDCSSSKGVWGEVDRTGRQRKVLR
jgi:hypothetical protein